MLGKKIFIYIRKCFSEYRKHLYNIPNKSKVIGKKKYIVKINGMKSYV